MNKKHETLQSSLKYGKNHEAAQRWKHVNIKFSGKITGLHHTSQKGWKLDFCNKFRVKNESVSLKCGFP